MFILKGQVKQAFLTYKGSNSRPGVARDPKMHNIMCGCDGLYSVRDIRKFSSVLFTVCNFFSIGGCSDSVPGSHLGHKSGPSNFIEGNTNMVSVMIFVLL